MHKIVEAEAELHSLMNQLKQDPLMQDVVYTLDDVNMVTSYEMGLPNVIELFVDRQSPHLQTFSKDNHCFH